MEKHRHLSETARVEALLQMERLFTIQVETFILMVHLEEITKIFESNSIRSVPESPEHCFYKSGPARSSGIRLPVMELIFYFGLCTQYGGAYYNLSIMNVRTRRVAYTNYGVSDIRRLSNGKLLVSATEFPHGGSLAIMNRNGSGRKLITRENVTQVSVKGKYITTQNRNNSWESRKCRCDLKWK